MNPVGFVDLVGQVAILVALVAIVGAACYYAGWRAAAAYFSAARAVSDISNAAVAQANEYATTLEKTEAALLSLRESVDGSTKTNAERSRAVEDALAALFSGFERAGFVKSARAVGRQVGEPPGS